MVRNTPGPRTASPLARAFSLRKNLESLWRRPGEREAVVDGLRALSMFWVIATHVILALSIYVDHASFSRIVTALPPSLAWIWHGEKALDTFFAISGLLIGRALIAEHADRGAIDIRRFYARRYLRLSPAYAVAILLIWAVGVEPAAKTRNIWANLLYVNNFLACDEMFMDWTWSLAVEEQFYLILPLFLVTTFFRSRRKVVLLGAIFVASFVVRGLLVALHPRVVSTSFSDHFFRSSPNFTCEYFESVYDNLYTRFGPFVVGVLVAYLQVRWPDRLRRVVGSHPLVNDGLLCAGAVLCLAVISAPIYDLEASLGRPFLTVYVIVHRNVWAVGVALVLVACLHPRGTFTRTVARFLAARAFYPVAQLSYCTYLFHLGFVVLSYLVVARLFHPAMEPKQALALFGLPELGLTFASTVVLSFAFGAVVYLLVERPVVNLRR